MRVHWKGVMLPAGLQSLTFGEECDGLEDVILPSGLQKLLLNGVCVSCRG